MIASKLEHAEQRRSKVPLALRALSLGIFGRKLRSTFYKASLANNPIMQVLRASLTSPATTVGKRMQSLLADVVAIGENQYGDDSGNSNILGGLCLDR